MGYYDEISSGYEELHKEEQLKKVRLIAEHLKVKKNDKLLDVGCGTGLTTESWHCKRYGIDPAPKLLERAREKEEIEYKLAAAEQIPYPEDFFDIVISITAIQNLKDIEKGLNRQLAPESIANFMTYLEHLEDKIINFIPAGERETVDCAHLKASLEYVKRLMEQLKNKLVLARSDLTKGM